MNELDSLVQHGFVTVAQQDYDWLFAFNGHAEPWWQSKCEHIQETTNRSPIGNNR